MHKKRGIKCPHCRKKFLEYKKMSGKFIDEKYQCPGCEKEYSNREYWELFNEKNTLEIMSKGVYYDSISQYIMRKSDGSPVAEIRGWGFFQYMDSAKGAQDAFGQFVTDAINEKLKRLERLRDENTD